MVLDLLVIGVSGFLGAIARYLVYFYFSARNLTSFPWATFTVNVFGCFLIGVIAALIERAIPYHRHLYLIGSVGFLGAFTTFSAFGLETLNLLRHENYSLAFLNVGANVAVGLGMVFLGRLLPLSF